MALSYFSSLQDVALSQDMIAKNPDLHIQKFEFIGSGVLDLTVPATATLTPATSPSWTIDEFNSTGISNLYVVDDNSKVAAALVDDTIATAITFDATATLLEEDGTTAASFTDTNTYDFYVLTPSTSANGPFFGYVEGAELTLTDEFMEFKYSRPRKLIRQDLLERAGEISGGNVNFDNEDILRTIFNSDTYGDQTGKFSHGVGSDPDTNKFYKLIFKGTDVNGRAITYVVRKAQFSLNGNLFSNSESGHFMIPFSAKILSDNFYPDDADMMQFTRVD